MVPRPPLALDEELRQCAEDGDPFDLTEAETEGQEGGCSSCGSDSDSMAEDSRLLGGGRGGAAPARVHIPRLTKVALALTLAACVGVAWKKSLPLHGGGGPAPEEPRRSSLALAQALPAAGVRALGENKVEVAVACSAHPRCLNAGKSTGNCCPNPQGVLDLCCDVGNMSQPPDTPFGQSYSTIYRDDDGKEYVRLLACGHMLCNEFAHCCANDMGYGICAAAADKCCGLIACGKTATCCGGICLSPSIPCLVNEQHGSGVTVD